MNVETLVVVLLFAVAEAFLVILIIRCLAPAPAATPVPITPRLENSIRAAMEARQNSYLVRLAS